MKKLLFVFSILSLFVYGCNRGNDQAGATGSGAGIEREEATSDEFHDETLEGQERMQERERRNQEDLDGQTPGFEKEQYRDDDANITTPIDSRPDLEEEE